MNGTTAGILYEQLQQKRRRMERLMRSIEQDASESAKLRAECRAIEESLDASKTDAPPKRCNDGCDQEHDCDKVG